MILNCATHKSLVVQEYDLQTSYFKENSFLTIAQLSDLHCDVYKNDQQPLVDALQTIQPDIIFLTGDIFDEKVPFSGVALLLEKIKKIAPVYYVTGNHEYYSGKIDQIRAMLKSHGVVVLADTWEEITVRENTIIIAGAEDPAKTKYEDTSYRTDTAKINLQKIAALPFYKILLVHRPEYARTFGHYAPEDCNFDLILSGHTHGGQVRLPGLINGLYAPGQGFFPKYAGGLYQTEMYTLIVSRGLTTRRPLAPRLFNPPEIVKIRIGNG